MQTGKRTINGIVVLLLLSIMVLVIAFSSVHAVSPPLRISIYPESVYIAPPDCKASFTVNVESDYKDKPIQLLYDEFSEGTWSGPGTLISSTHYDGQRQYSSFPVAPDYQTVVTVNVVAPWQKQGEYKVRVYAFPEGTDPFQYGVYQVLTIVIQDTGIDKCDPDYWPPPPSDTEETTDIIIDTKDGWPPPDETTDIITDGTDSWRWWRWWRFDWQWWRTWWYRWWPWSVQEFRADRESQETFNFDLSIVPSLHAIEPGQSVFYTVNADHRSGAPQPVSLNISGLPAGAAASFSVASATPSFSSVLTIATDQSLSPGTYPLTVTGNGGGKTHAVTVSMIVAEGRKNTVLSIYATPPLVQADDQVTVEGTLSPPLAVPIELLLIRPDGFEMIKHVKTSPEGTFSDHFHPDQSGSWLIRARWFGNDDYFGCESPPTGLSVEGAAEALTERPSPWELIFGILSAMILIIFIVLIIYLIIRRIRKPKAA